MILNPIQAFLVFAIPVLFAITVHEVAHGFIAERLGDPTARMLGRITLNPIKHIDPLGTILVPLMGYVLGGFIIGWAKPVPIGVQNFKHKKRDMAIVSLAGPGANILMMLLWAGAVKISFLMAASSPWAAYILQSMGMQGIMINIILAVFNLLPLPPLDGSHVIDCFLSPKASYQYNRLAPYGFWILLGLLFTGVLAHIMTPLMGLMFSLIHLVFNI